MLVKIAFTFVPAVVMTPTQTSAISAISSAYSSRSCPSSLTANARIRAMRFIM